MPNKFLLQIEGHLGKDPEFSNTKNGKPTCYFSVAVTKKGEEKKDDKTAWFNINAYCSAVDQCHVLKKGSAVLIETDDPMSIRGYKRAGNDGEEYINLSISTFKVLAISWQKRQEERQEQPQQERQPRPEPQPQPISEEDLPF